MSAVEWFGNLQLAYKYAYGFSEPNLCIKTNLLSAFASSLYSFWSLSSDCSRFATTTGSKQARSYKCDMTVLTM